MINARWAHVAGFAAVAALAVATVTGCGATDSGTDKPAADKPSTPADPRETLLDAVPDQQDGAFRFTVKGGTTPSSGVLDVAKQAAEITIVQTEKDPDFTMKLDTRTVGGKFWVRLAFTPASLPGLPKLPKKWMLLDPAKLKNANDLKLAAEDTDPGYTSQVVENAAGITEKSPHHYAGTTDLTKLTEADIVDAATLKALGAKAKAVPFQAVVDAAGHLTGITLAIPAAGKTKAQKYAVSYTGFGGTTAPAAPAAGEQQKAVATIYEFMNG